MSTTPPQPANHTPRLQQSPTLNQCRHALTSLIKLLDWQYLKLDVTTRMVLERLEFELAQKDEAQRNQPPPPSLGASSTFAISPSKPLTGPKVPTSLSEWEASRLPGCNDGPVPDIGQYAYTAAVTRAANIGNSGTTGTTTIATTTSLFGDDTADDALFQAALSSLPVDTLQTLSKEQAFIWDQVMAGKSVFITGPAGTGKTHLVNILINDLAKKHPKGSIFVTATTGVAATHVNGTTVHHFSGLFDSNENWGLSVKKISGKARQRWQYARVLFIDEISMMSAKFFDMLDFAAKEVRGKRNEPFGGLQVIACGDFFQLPPVYHKTKEEKDREAAARRARRERMNDIYDNDENDEYVDEEIEQPPRNDGEKFAFERTVHDAWIKLFGANQFSLKTSFRQTDDRFIRILNNIRTGSISAEDFCRLNDCVYTEFPPDVKPIYLSPHKKTAEAHNQRELAKLKAAELVYTSSDTGDAADASNMLDKNTLAPRTLVLKPGAQVLLLKNLDIANGLVNGSRGQIIAMSSDLDNTNCEGEEEDGMEVEEPVTHMTIFLGKKKTGTKESTKQKKGDPSWPNLPDRAFTEKGFENIPLVRFESKSADCPHGILKWITPASFEVMSGDVCTARRLQLPLMLGYAVTIHKSQGMTLQYAQIDVKEVFAPGQAYVAFSRLQSIKGLKITERFEEHVIHAHPMAIAYQRALDTGNFELLD
jgi:ATP-dependent DNA helicase PIF1